MNSTMRRLICSAVAILAGVPSAFGAEAPSARVTAADFFLVQLASDPQISPDGRQIVYVRNFADIMTDRRYSDLWIVDADGNRQRPLTSGNRSDVSPRWSPDGTRLAYVAEIDGRGQIMVRWMDSGQTAQLTNLEEAPQNISWSPDGKLIAFTALVPSKPPQIADLPVPPAGAKWADPAKIYDQLVYRFDGAGYLKPGYSQIFVVSSEGGVPRQVSQGNYQNGGWTETQAHPVWTPDGNFLIASINRHENYQVEPFDTDLYELSVADGSSRALTTRKGPDNDPAVSPDGKRIAYVGFDDRYQGYQVTRLYIMNRDGSNAHVVSEKLDRDISSPVWAENGSGVYVKYEDQGDTKIGFFGNDGAFKRIAEHLASGTNSYDFGSSFSVAKSGAVAYTYGTPTLPGDVGLVNRATRLTLTDLNRGYLAQRALGSVEEIRWPSSLDKREIHGFIVKPPDFNPAKKYPLILEIHGGPFANYGDRFDLSKQAWASAGYVVLYTNPRGSASYGEEFGNLIHHAYPGDDFQDLNSGVDAVIAKGYIDARNLFVTGGSGGGVLTSWVIEHTDRFRAAAILYPVINWYSFALTTDIPYITKYWFPGLPWNESDNYMRRSLTTLVSKVKTPSLLMTGEEDYRTPISEAEQFYAALKLQNVESVLVRVPGEPHGLRRFPSHAASTSLIISSWFERHKVP